MTSNASTTKTLIDRLLATPLRTAAHGLAAGALGLGLLGGVAAEAQTPLLVGYQGALFDAQGQPAQGSADVDVAIFDAAQGGTRLYAESHTGVPLVDGTFDLQIGSGTSPSGVFDEQSFAGPEAWLELTVDGEVLTPRQRLVAVPYAIRAKVAESLDGSIGSVPFADQAGHAATADRVLSAGTAGADQDLLGYGIDAAGNPVLDGGRVQFRNNYFPSGGGDAIVFEKTDGNDADPDGGFVFVNTGVDGIEEPAMALRGDGRIGIGTLAPQAKLDVAGETHVDNLRSDGWGWFENDSDYQTLVARNRGVGQVLWLENNGVGDFIVAWDTTLSGSQRRRFWVDDQGVTNVRTLKIHGGADLSERFDVASSTDAVVEPGTVLTIDPDGSGRLTVSDAPYSTRVAGIIAGAGGIAPGMVMHQEGVAETGGQHPVALTGRVYAKADTSNGAIRPGDLLTTSSRPGHAMRATDSARANGAILGKAMTRLDEETGMVLVLIGLQ